MKLRPIASKSLYRSCIRGLASACHRPASGFWRLAFGGRPAAFTLVELMVVVAVIALLLMMVIPNIRTMREKAWMTHCQNNLRQYGIGMNQYMADHGGFFIYPGKGVGGTHDGTALGGSDIGDFSMFDNRKIEGATVGGQRRDKWGALVQGYVGTNPNLSTLSAGEPSVRVCPAVLQELKRGNYFDPNDPDFKGYGQYPDPWDSQMVQWADFEEISGAGYDNGGALRPDYRERFLDATFTTYAINPLKITKAASNCPAHVIAFIDWNAREGWNATLFGEGPQWGYPTRGTNEWMFTSPDGTIQQHTFKGSTNWWHTEVGFHHPLNNEYGANYLAMDASVGWISSNAISRTNFAGF